MSAASRQHGTRACYAAGCRRPECAKANRAAENHRQRMILYGTWQPYVDADRARQHVRALGAAGIGWKTAARLAGLTTSTVGRLLHGGPRDRPPTRRIRAETEQKILAVSPGPQSLRPHRPVSATGTRRRLQALIACGYSGASLATRLGMSPQNFGTMLTRCQVLAATARAARQLYDQLWDVPPAADSHRTRQSASRARNHAAARGWPPPAAWDDDTIDDPAGRPAEGWQRGRDAVDVEGALELLARGHTRQNVAGRFGITHDSLNTALARAQRKAS